MADAIRLVTVNVGRDPHDFVLYIQAGLVVCMPSTRQGAGHRNLVLPLSDLASV